MPLLPEIRLYQAADPISMWQQTEQATGQDDLDPPFWAFPWAGGQALARYLLDHQETVLGRRVIDIASGSGLVAIAAAKAGAGAVTAYDTDPLAVAAIGVNAAANRVEIRAVGADILGADGPPSPGADLVLVADAFYERDLAGQVTTFLGRCRARGAGVLVGDFGRRYLPYSRLAALASYDVPGLGALESRDVVRTTVWTLSGDLTFTPSPRGTRLLCIWAGLLIGILFGLFTTGHAWLAMVAAGIGLGVLWAASSGSPLTWPPGANATSARYAG